jgi:hypothetical protein
MAKQPCSICEEETAAGSPRYSDRHTTKRPEGSTYICSGCHAQRTPRPEANMDEEELRRLEKGASLFGIWFSPSSH